MNIDEFLSTLPENVVKGGEVELTDGVVKKMFKLAGLRKGDVFYHLGCGQGNAVKIAAKEFGVKKAVGIEADEKLAEKARKKVAGIKNAVIERGDMLKADISSATVVMFWPTEPATVETIIKKLRTLKDGARVVTAWSPPGMMMPDKVEFPFFVCKKPFKRARSVRQQIKAVYGSECIDFTASWLLAERYIDALEVVPDEYRRFVNMLQSMVIWINAWNMGISCEDGVPPPVQTYLGILREFFGLDLSDMFTREPKDESMTPPAGMNC